MRKNLRVSAKSAGKIVAGIPAIKQTTTKKLTQGSFRLLLQILYLIKKWKKSIS